MKLIACRKVVPLYGHNRRRFFKPLLIMKLTALFLLVCCIQVSARSDAQQVTLEATNFPLKRVLQNLKKQTGFSFFYPDLLLKKSRPVSVVAKNKSLHNVLDLIFKDQQLTYEFVDDKLILIKEKEHSLKSMVQHMAAVALKQIEITGKIVNDKGEPVEGASVSEKGNGNSRTSDKKGLFTINVANEKAVLVITHIGYMDQQISVEGKTNLTITLVPKITNIEDVVIIGYQSVKRKDLTGAVSSLNSKQLRDVPVNSTAEALTGRIAGVQITTSEGGPGAEATITIRGGGSITQDNSPLYIIDGVQVEGGLNTISPQDIETIDVLKDASATAIYGARGANGVVLITTKGNKEMKPVVSYNGMAGYNLLASKLTPMNPYDFVLYQYERSRRTAQDSLRFVQAFGTTFDTLQVYKNIPMIDWQERVMGEKALMQTHNISIGGGNKQTKYNVSYTNNNQKGIITNSEYQRQLINLKLSQTVSNRLKMTFSARYNAQTITGAGTSSTGTSTFNNLRSLVKYIPFDKNPLIADDEFDQEYFDETNAQGNGLGVVNPIVLNNSLYRRTRSDEINIGGNLEFTINKYLSLTSVIGFDRTDMTKRTFDDWLTPNARINGSAQPMITSTTSLLNTLNQSNVLTYSNANGTGSFKKKNSLTVLLGNEINIRRSNALENQFKLFPVGFTPDLAFNQLQQGSIVPTYPQASYWPSKLSSFFTRANYTFDRKYLFSFTFRADGSSKFAEGNNWGYFPSGAFAWRLSEEKFLKNNSVVSDAKLRLSYGTSGNNRIGDFLYSSLFNATALYGLNENLSSIGLAPVSLPNRNLKWETTISRNIGLDLSLFQNKVSLTVDVYKNSTRDLLLNAPVNLTSGWTTQLRNVGETSNQGLEIQVSSTLVKKKDFTWSASYNMSFNRNKVVRLNESQDYYYQNSGWGVSGQPADFIVQVGKPVGSMYGFIADGFYTVDDFDYNPATSVYTLKKGGVDPSKIYGMPAQPGLMKVRDVDDNQVISEADKQIIGNATPTFYGGLNQQFTYRGFDMSVFVNFQYGNDILNANKVEFTNGYNASTNLLSEMNGRWRTVDANGNVLQRLTGSVVTGVAPDMLKAQNQNASIWMPVQGSAAFFPTSWAVEDGSFIRVNNITLGYTFNSSFLKKLSISNLRVYGTANNLAVITGYSGYDPEVNTRRATPVTPGVDYAAFPRSRTFLFGVNLSF